MVLRPFLSVTIFARNSLNQRPRECCDFECVFENCDAEEWSKDQCTVRIVHAHLGRRFHVNAKPSCDAHQRALAGNVRRRAGTIRTALEWTR